ncbi:hypothetical protein ACHHYP_20241 [Achlya hypogyna]|uniref:PDZ domain-containing protein n=1 Tax=Achlya hypogyna TaxID=1202772 RepID=A0A1V9YVZ1_ACHHY|nr:hypothetical protein ACHHYP_20241 [Achlya hypogyna]
MGRTRPSCIVCGRPRAADGPVYCVSCASSFFQVKTEVLRDASEQPTAPAANLDNSGKRKRASVEPSGLSSPVSASRHKTMRGHAPAVDGLQHPTLGLDEENTIRHHTFGSFCNPIAVDQSDDDDYVQESLDPFEMDNSIVPSIQSDLASRQIKAELPRLQDESRTRAPPSRFSSRAAAAQAHARALRQRVAGNVLDMTATSNASVPASTIEYVVVLPKVEGVVGIQLGRRGNVVCVVALNALPSGGLAPAAASGVVSIGDIVEAISHEPVGLSPSGIQDKIEAAGAFVVFKLRRPNREIVI